MRAELIHGQSHGDGRQEVPSEAAGCNPERPVVNDTSQPAMLHPGGGGSAASQNSATSWRPSVHTHKPEGGHSLMRLGT